MGVGVISPPPAAIERQGEGGGSGWAHLVRARDDIDAHLLTGRLEQSGIEARTVVDRTVPGAWLHGGSNPWAPVHVFVRRHQLEDARIVLAEISYDAPASSATQEWGRRRLPTVWWISAIGIAAVLTVVALGQALNAGPICRALPFCEEARTP